MLLAQITPTTVDSGFPGGAAFIILFVLFVPVSMAFFTAWLATERGRAGRIWFVLGFFFGPIALLSVGLAPERGSGRARVASDGSIASGLRSILSNEPSSRARPAPQAADEPAAPAAPAPVPAAPVTSPSRLQQRPAAAPIEIDVDGAVFHELSNRAYGRGRVADGSTAYFVISSDDKFRELSEALRVARPQRRLVLADDVIPIEALPPELQR